MGNKKVSLDQMFKQLAEWRSEVKNFRNDGFVQEGYREKFTLLHERIVTIMADINEVQSEDDPQPNVIYRPDPRKED